MESNEIVARFPGARKISDSHYEAHCPAHDDKHPSCHIYINDDWVNVRCYAGCSEDEILQAAGLTKKDLFIGEPKEKAFITNRITYYYHDAKGNVSHIKERLELSDGSKKFNFRKPDGKYGLQGQKHLLYNLPAVSSAPKVFFVEGEKCADALNSAGCVATTLDSGANSKWQPEFTEWLENKKIIILPDNDKPGMRYAKMIKTHLPNAVIKTLPGIKEKEDAFDWLQAGHKVSEIDDLPETMLDDEVKTTSAETNNHSEIPIGNKTQSELLLSLIKNEKIELFLNQNHDPFAEIPSGDHKEIMAVESSDFSLLAQQRFYKATNKTIRQENLKQTIAILFAEAKFNGKDCITLYNRVARHNDEFWYDLTSPSWKAVRVSSSGWSVTNEVPRLFCRYRHQQTQVTPQSNGEITKIFQYINMTRYQMLFLCWLISCFVPDIPHPMPIFYGEKGAAKSTTCVLLKRLIDPSVLDTLQLSKDERSLIVNLQQHYYLPFDNVSAITKDISDTLCRAVTGSAVQQRKLFSNSEDFIFAFQRCLTVNGISNVANSSDLLDRSILFELERVSEDDRMELQEVYEKFEEDRPHLLGAIFNILSSAMAIYPTVSLEKLPRMADFCRWGYAIAEAIGGHGEVFLQEYSRNQDIQNVEAINADAVAFLIVELMRSRDEWKGKMSELLRKLQELAQNHGFHTNSKASPPAPNALSRRIKSVKSNLETAGITYVIEDNHSDGTYIVITNKNISPLPKYYVNPSQIMGLSNGDNNGDFNPLDDLPPLTSPQDNQPNGENGDNGDDFDDIEF